MNEPEVMHSYEKRERRTAQLVVALMVLVAVIYAMTFIQLPVWLPAL